MEAPSPQYACGYGMPLYLFSVFQVMFECYRLRLHKKR